MPKRNLRKPYTYDQLATKFGMTTNAVHDSIDSTYNKIVSRVMDETGEDIFDAVKAVTEYFGMSEVEAFEKLNDRHKQQIRLAAAEKYHINTDEETDFGDIFS